MTELRFVYGSEMAEHSQMQAADLFGGRENLMSTIIRQLRNRRTSRLRDQKIIEISQKLSAPSIDPRELFAQMTRSQFLDLLFVLEIPLNDVMPLTWKDRQEDYDRWKAEFEQRGNQVFTLIEEEGAEHAERFFITLCAQMEALEEICADPPKMSEQQVARIRLLREKYKQHLELNKVSSEPRSSSAE